MSGLAACVVVIALAQAAESTATPTAAATSTATVDDTAVRPERSAGAEAPARSRRAATSTPPPTPRPRPPAASAEADRDQALRLARTFLEALAAGDSNALAQAGSDRFSFDGDAASGREAVRRRWREILVARSGPAPRVNGVEVLAAQDALARYGKPPARVAALARPGGWVAVGDVGGRPVVLFVAREGGRLAVLGIHD
jgi:hypothetical protein